MTLLSTYRAARGIYGQVSCRGILAPSAPIVHCFCRPPLCEVRSACERLLSKRSHLARIEEETSHFALAVLLGYD